MKEFDCCSVVRINGVICHETGCHDSWNSSPKECAWCGDSFTPKNRFDNHCSESCYFKYNGIDCESGVI